MIPLVVTRAIAQGVIARALPELPGFDTETTKRVARPGFETDLNRAVVTSAMKGSVRRRSQKWTGCQQGISEGDEFVAPARSSTRSDCPRRTPFGLHLVG